MKSYSNKQLKSSKQKIYKMKGCSSKTKKNRIGGKSLGNLLNINANNLAIPAKNITFLPNPNLAYTGKGGSNLSCRGDTNVNGYSTNDVLAFTGTKSPISNAYPSTGPVPRATNWLGSQQKGGCNCGQNYAVQAGGSSFQHRPECKCSSCKQNVKKGGNGLPYGQGLPQMKGPSYPDGLVGSPWSPSVADWPGVDGIPGDRNYLEYNTYSPVDISREMIDTGANPPFSIDGSKKNKKTRFNKRSKKGGVSSNMLSQDLINLGRQFQFNLGSSYNALNGYKAPVNPLPWKDQIPTVSQKYSIY
jgi:hypothetical protein